jgi:hypothetical protein
LATVNVYLGPGFAAILVIDGQALNKVVYAAEAVIPEDKFIAGIDRSDLQLLNIEANPVPDVEPTTADVLNAGTD